MRPSRSSQTARERGVQDPPVDSAPPCLLISTSPRSTWLWAADADMVARVREVVGWRPATYEGVEQPLVSDIDIGVDAYETCQRLAAAGFTFGWHDTQHPFNRYYCWDSDLPGMPEVPAGFNPHTDVGVLQEVIA